MIQTQVRDDRDGVRQLTPNDREYWDGAYRYEPYPKCLYRATGPERDAIETTVVQYEQDHQTLGPAWCETPDAARAYLRRLDDEVAKAAAQSATDDMRMGEQAQAHRRAVEQSTDEMVTEIPQAKKKPGRPAKLPAAE